MDNAQPFRAQLALRILGVLEAATLALAPGCGGTGASASAGTTHGAGGGGGAAAVTATGAGTGGATTGAGSTSAGFNLFDAGLPDSTVGVPLMMMAQECLHWPPSMGSCPTDHPTIIALLKDPMCPTGWDAAKVDSGPTVDATGQCCYVVELELCAIAGRPYLVGGRARVAAPERSASGSGWNLGQGPKLDGLTGEDRAALAAAWTSDALLEHASVASFARFSLALMAAGAPADLVELAHQAALDEIRHARLCFALATAYAGEAVAPGPFPLGGEVHVGSDLAALAVSTVREGCIGETIAAVLAAEQLARATDPAVRAALELIAADEACHAELAWRTVAWAVRVGDREVRAAVERALKAALAEGCRAPAAAATGSDAMAAHGRLDAPTAAQVVASAMVDIVAPAARALLRRADPTPAEASGEQAQA